MKTYSEYSYWWILLIAVISFVIAYFQYQFKIKNSVFSKVTKLVLTILRFCLLFIIGILLLNFYSKFFKNEYIKPVLLVAVDNSQSMIKAKDSLEVKKFLSQQFPEMIQQLQNNFDVQIMTFGEKILFQDSFSFNEAKTNPENIFFEPQQVIGNKPINAMLLISDGIFNEGVHPIAETDNVTYPVYVLATGDTNTYKDVFVKKILCNKNVFIGNDFITEVLIQSSAISNEKVKVKISESNNILAEKEIIINSDKNSLESIQFQLHAQTGGYHTYKVQVSVVKDEVNIHNNTAYFVVNVIENKTKILFLYSAPHPDISAIRQVLNTSPQYEIEVASDDIFTKEISKYDVVVYHSPNSNSNTFQKCLNSGTPMFILNPSLNIIQNKLLVVKQFVPQYNEIETFVNTGFSAFSITDEYSQIQNDLPIILAPYGNYAPAGESQILYYQKINNVLTDLPLLYFTQTSFGKYAVFLGDGLWRWKMANYQIKQNTQWFEHLMTQIIRYLSVKRDKNPFKVYVPATTFENEPLQITAELLNESMQLITEPDVFIQLYDENNHEYKYVFNKSTSNYFLNAGVLPAGEYKYKAYTQYKGKDYAQTGKIHIVPQSIEKNNLVAQHHLLKLLAQKTSGQFFNLKDADKIAESITKDENIKTIVIQNETFQYWIDNQWWFIIIVCLAIAEWTIRRWNGIV